MDMMVIAQTTIERQLAILIAAEQFVQKEDIQCTLRCGW